jgi:hypothetical protein
MNLIKGIFPFIYKYEKIGTKNKEGTFTKVVGEYPRP